MVFALFASSVVFALSAPPVEFGTHQVASENSSPSISEIKVSLEKNYSTIRDDRYYLWFLFGPSSDIFVSGAAIVNYFSSLFGGGVGGKSSTPKPSEYPIDFVLETMSLEYEGVIRRLSGVYQEMNKEQVQPYYHVQATVNGALSDMKSNSSVELNVRAMKLYDQVEFFLSGMLRNNTVGVDIVRAVRRFKSVSKFLFSERNYI